MLTGPTGSTKARAHRVACAGNARNAALQVDTRGHIKVDVSGGNLYTGIA